MDAVTEVARCTACGAPGPYPLVFARSGRTLVRCTRCGLVFQQPPPDESELQGAYYHDELFSTMLFSELASWTHLQASARRDLLGHIFEVKPGRLLDVGCSSGAWLEVAAGDGWQGTGVEVGATTARLARGIGLDVRTGTLLDNMSDLPKKSFELVTFWDVLEHLLQPDRELKAVHDLLAPSGVVAMTFPNIRGLMPQLSYRLLARPFGVWEHPELPAHIYDFSPRSARALLESCGFEVVAITTYNSPWEWYAVNTGSPAAMGGGRKGKLLAALLDGLHVLAYPIGRALDRGNGLMVVARPIAS